MKSLVCAVLFLAGGLSPARAEVPADGLKRLDAAVAALNTLTAKVKSEGRLPKLDRPGEKPVLEALWDEPALLGAPPYTQKDVPALTAITKKELAVTVQYLFSAGGTPEQNADRYIDEIIHGEVFTLQASSDLLPALTDFVAHLPPDEMTETRKRGLRQIRLGMNQYIQGLATELRADVSEENKALMASVLEKNAATIAGAVTPEERSHFAGYVSAAVPSVSAALKPRLEAFIRAMGSQECTGLCLLR